MDQSRRLRLWFVLALIVALVVAALLWLRGALFEDNDVSPLPTPLVLGESPLPTPTQASAAPATPASWSNRGAALLWVTLGIGLALCIAFFILRWDRRAIE
ncbi:MAG TPA: hypothetical protein G4N99_02625 [Thermoflexia bacterium]|nr:hypothetical protein [Thermoflexia bacterium]